MDATGNLSVLFVFPGGELGYRPGPLMQGTDGALYGTAVGGSMLYIPGIVYRFDPVTRDYRILHTFVTREGRYLDGKNPSGKLLQARDGFFYGTTLQGGPSNAGVVYKIDAAGSFAVVHAFDSFEGSEAKAGIIQASDGSFYGTLEHGGYGGKIFRLDAAGNFTTVYAFGPYSANGWAPISNPIEARDGFLYGTTPRGGSSPSGSYGVVYRLSRSGALTVLHSFSGADGISPYTSLTQAANGVLYGSTIVGGAFGLGTLFKIAPAAPALPPLPRLTVLTIAPAQVHGGSSATGTVTLSGVAPPSGASVALSSTSLHASVPGTLTVPAGASTASFAVGTWPTSWTRVATITARYNGSQVSAALTITR
jgi:uncharacterized repeat protein (TIGR03803 family)